MSELDKLKILNDFKNAFLKIDEQLNLWRKLDSAEYPIKKLEKTIENGIESLEDLLWLIEASA